MGVLQTKEECYRTVWNEEPNANSVLGWNTMKERGFCVRGYGPVGDTQKQKVSM